MPDWLDLMTIGIILIVVAVNVYFLTRLPPQPQAFDKHGLFRS